MTTPRFEHFLARLYVEEDLRRRFLTDARGTAAAAGLSPTEIEALAHVDLTGLELASRSYALKRQANPRAVRGRSPIVGALLRFLRLRR
jgi:hypothetical protein